MKKNQIQQMQSLVSCPTFHPDNQKHFVLKVSKKKNSSTFLGRISLSHTNTSQRLINLETPTKILKKIRSEADSPFQLQN